MEYITRLFGNVCPDLLDELELELEVIIKEKITSHKRVKNINIDRQWFIVILNDRYASIDETICEECIISQNICKAHQRLLTYDELYNQIELISNNQSNEFDIKLTDVDYNQAYISLKINYI